MTPAIAEAFEAARAERNLSYSQVRDAVRDRLGTFAPSTETIRQYHTATGRAAKVPNLVVIGAIADVYGSTLKELDPALTEQLDAIREVLFRGFGWTLGTAGDHMLSRNAA